MYQFSSIPFLSEFTVSFAMYCRKGCHSRIVVRVLEVVDKLKANILQHALQYTVHLGTEVTENLGSINTLQSVTSTPRALNYQAKL